MTTTQSPAVLLIAISARPYVKALKQAGYYVVVIDGFLDQETRFFADEVYQVAYDLDGFKANDLLSVLDQISLLVPALGYVIGSGLEARPNLISKINQRYRLIGNAPSIIQALKSPDVFFTKLQPLGLSVPEWQTADAGVCPMVERSEWLKKRIGGAGGTHITEVKSYTSILPENEYYQAKLTGKAVSVLFMAFPQKTLGLAPLVVGFNAQWCDENENAPYQIGGIASNVTLESEVEKTLVNAVSTVSAAFGLVGLNSLDVIIDEQQVFVLEVNPRFSLSLDLYLQDYINHAQVNLLALHIYTCLQCDQSSENRQIEIKHAIQKILAYHKTNMSMLKKRAIGIVYADEACTIRAQTSWPDWVVDKPSDSAVYQSGWPICSVTAQANSIAQVRKEIARKKQLVISLVPRLTNE